MDQRETHSELSFRECCQVVGVASGFALVFSLLAWLSFAYSIPQTVLKTIPNDFRAGKLKLVLAECVGGLFGAVMIPGATIASLLAIWHGAHGRRTVLTEFILISISQTKNQELIEKSIGATDTSQDLAVSDDANLGNISPKVGWAILLGFVLIAVGILIYSALRPG